MTKQWPNACMHCVRPMLVLHNPLIEWRSITERHIACDRTWALVVIAKSGPPEGSSSPRLLMPGLHTPSP